MSSIIVKKEEGWVINIQRKEQFLAEFEDLSENLQEEVCEGIKKIEQENN